MNISSGGNEPFSERITQINEGEIIAENIRSLNFEYFDGLEWFEEWIAASEENEEGPTGLPRAVRITLEIGLAEEEEPASFSTVAFLPMTRFEEEEEAVEE